MNADVRKAMVELFSSLAELTKAKRKYYKAIATSKEKSEELSTLLSEVINQPRIIIDDYELDN